MTAPLTAQDLASLTPVTSAVSAEYLEHQGVLPIRTDGNTLWVGTWHTEVDPRTVDDLGIVLGCEVVALHGEESQLRAAIRRIYGGEASTAQELIEGITHEPAALTQATALDDLLQQATEGPVIRLVNMLLLEALAARASDIHLEQYASGLVVRYRIDGILQEAPSPPAHLAAAVVSRLKIMADLDIAERRLPQDGRIRVRLSDREVDVRISTIPLLHGESVVLRLLDTGQVQIGIDDIGMAADVLEQFRGLMRPSGGIILATGPTGSGKSTTLYAALELVRTGREKILTVEDPVEYQLFGLAQVPVNTKVGLTFARALRAILRQDPDVLLVGEIRDAETAEIATHAALTGHLVLSTLHTNDAATGITRLLDLGIAPYLVSSTVSAVLAQRLVRRICRHCCAERDLTDEEMEMAASHFGVEPDLLPRMMAEGVGCETCRHTGFRGRTGMYELLTLSEQMREEVLQRPSSTRIDSLAIGQGMRSLKQDGLRLIREGTTTINEVIRVTN